MVNALSGPGLVRSPLGVLPPNNLVNLVGVPVSLLGGTGLLLPLPVVPESPPSFSALVMDGLDNSSSSRGIILRPVDEMKGLDEEEAAKGSWKDRAEEWT